MSFPYLEKLVTDARTILKDQGATPELRTLLQNSMADADHLADEIAQQPEDEILLFEDNSCSIWTCRFSSDVVMPPHEHCMPVHIAVYRGDEVQVLYHREDNHLRHAKNRSVEAGQVVSLGADAVHAVTASGDIQSHAVHIYQGPLTTIKRALFDWDSGDKVDFTMENFHAMTRKRREVVELQE